MLSMLCQPLRITVNKIQLFVTFCQPHRMLLNKTRFLSIIKLNADNFYLLLGPYSRYRYVYTTRIHTIQSIRLSTLVYCLLWLCYMFFSCWRGWKIFIFSPSKSNENLCTVVNNFIVASKMPYKCQRDWN